MALLVAGDLDFSGVSKLLKPRLDIPAALGTPVAAMPGQLVYDNIDGNAANRGLKINLTGTTWSPLLGNAISTAAGSSGTLLGLSSNVGGAVSTIDLPVAAAGTRDGLLSAADKTKLDKAVLTDSTLTSWSWVTNTVRTSGMVDTLVPTEAAVRTAITNALSGALNFRGSFNPMDAGSVCTSGTTLVSMQIAGATVTAANIAKNDFVIASTSNFVVGTGAITAGKWFTGIRIEVGDMLIALKANPTTIADWNIVQSNTITTLLSNTPAANGSQAANGNVWNNNISIGDTFEAAILKLRGQLEFYNGTVGQGFITGAVLPKIGATPIGNGDMLSVTYTGTDNATARVTPVTNAQLADRVSAGSRVVSIPNAAAAGTAPGPWTYDITHSFNANHSLQLQALMTLDPTPSGTSKYTVPAIVDWASTSDTVVRIYFSSPQPTALKWKFILSTLGV